MQKMLREGENQEVEIVPQTTIWHERKVIMQIRTECPQCGKSYWLDDEYEGVEAQCEDCGCQFMVTRVVQPSDDFTKKSLFCTQTFVPWLVLFAIQFAGFLVSCLLAYLFSLLIISLGGGNPAAIIVATAFSLAVELAFTAIVSYLSFRFIVVKMIANRISKKG